MTFFALFSIEKSATPPGMGEMECVPGKNILFDLFWGTCEGTWRICLIFCVPKSRPSPSRMSSLFSYFVNVFLTFFVQTWGVIGEVVFDQKRCFF